jgi:hypothetical protein
VSDANRMTLNLPPEFDASRHSSGLPAMAKKLTDTDGWVVLAIEGRVATLVRRDSVDQVEKSAPSSGRKGLRVKLAGGTKPSDGDKVATTYADLYPGSYMVKFEPHLGYALLAELTDDEVRARGQLALAMRCKPWEIQIDTRPDGGYMARLPFYVPSKHDKPLTEAVEQIGKFGWYFTVNTKTLVAQIIPSEPATFPEVIPLNTSRLGHGDCNVTPFGMALPAPGEKVGDTVAVNWSVAHAMLMGGLPGSGKMCIDSTPVPVEPSAKHPNGWATHGELTPGMRVFGVDGRPVTVSRVHPARTVPVAVVRFVDGQSATVGMDHYWTVRDMRSSRPRGGGGSVLPADRCDDLATMAHRYLGWRGYPDTIAQHVDAPPAAISAFLVRSGIPRGEDGTYPIDEAIAAWALHRRRYGENEAPTLGVRSTAELMTSLGKSDWAVPASGAVRYVDNDVDLPLDPYLLGAWLALDGDYPSGGPTFNECARETLADATGGRPLTAVVNEAGLNGVRTIPSAYLTASVNQRLELVRGLMDYAGWTALLGRCQLRPTSAGGKAATLIRSLGMLVQTTDYGALTFEATMDVHRRRDLAETHARYAPLVNSLARAIDPSTTGSGAWNRIESITAAGRATARCIEVDDPRHLYLIGDFIPTHNTVTVNAILADLLSNGSEIVVVDTLDKSVDFFWLKPYVRDGGWGCGSLEASVTALGLVYEEAKHRAAFLGENGFKNWMDIPKSDRFAPITVVIDEISALMVPDKIPAGIDKKAPDVQQMLATNMLKFRLSRLMDQLIAEMRFVGVRMLLSSQVTNTNTGVALSTKAKVGHRGLQGLSPSKTARGQAFDDERAVPEVPDNVKEDPNENVSRGVGVCHLSTMTPVVYKSFFISDSDLVAALERLNLRKTTRPEPTPEEIARFVTPEFDEDQGDSGSAETFGGDRPPSGKPLDPKFGPTTVYSDDGQPLRGAAAAAAASKQAAALCHSCGKPIKPNGDCGCS